MIGNYGIADFSYDAVANPMGFTAFSQYGGWGGDLGAVQGQHGGGHASIKQLKHRLTVLQHKFQASHSGAEKAHLARQIKHVKGQIASLKSARSGSLRGSSGHNIRGRSGPNVHGRSGPVLRGSSGRSNHVQRNALRRFRSGAMPSKILRQGQQQGETAYAQEDAGEITDADLQVDLAEDGLEDGDDPEVEYGEPEQATAGWGNWGMGNAFGSSYVALYGGAPMGGYGATSPNELAQKLHALKAKLHRLETVKRAAKGDAKKQIKLQIAHVKAQIKAIEKQLKSKHHLLGVGRHKDARNVAIDKRKLLVKKALAARSKRVTGRTIMRKSLVPHGRLRFPRMAYGPTGPVAPPGVFLQGQAPGASAFNPYASNAYNQGGGYQESGGNINDYFDTSREGQLLTPGADDPVSSSMSADGTDDSEDGGTDWGSIAKWGLGIGAVIAVVAVLAKHGKKSKSKSKSSSSSSSDAAAA